AVLKATSVTCHNLPDNRFDQIPLLDVVKLIEGVQRRVQADTVFTQHGGDLNIDHAITYRATLTALRPVGDTVVRALYAYEVPSSTEWAFQTFAPVFAPNLFVDIAATLARKIAALRCYDTEIRAFPHPRSPEALEALARRWGSVAGLGAAEAFQ